MFLETSIEFEWSSTSERRWLFINARFNWGILMPPSISFLINISKSKQTVQAWMID